MILAAAAALAALLSSSDPPPGAGEVRPDATATGAPRAAPPGGSHATRAATGPAQADAVEAVDAGGGSDAPSRAAPAVAGDALPPPPPPPDPDDDVIRNLELLEQLELLERLELLDPGR